MKLYISDDVWDDIADGNFLWNDFELGLEGEVQLNFEVLAIKVEFGKVDAA